MFFSRKVVDYNGKVIILNVPSNINNTSLLSALNTFMGTILEAREEGIEQIYVASTNTMIDIKNITGFVVQYKFLGFKYREDRWGLKK